MKNLSVFYGDDKKEHVVNPDTDQEEYQLFLNKIENYSGEVVADVELYCWARKDDEKHELIVGFTPRLISVRLLELTAAAEGK